MIRNNKIDFDPWLISQKFDAKTAVLLTLTASLFGKALGFIRLQQISETMGASMYSDALIVALQLVWLVETVLVSSALAPMVVSQIYKIDKADGGDAAIIFFLHTAIMCSGFAIVTTGLGLFFSDRLIQAITPGLDRDGRAVLISLLCISAATPLFMILAHFLALLNRLMQNGVWYSVPQIVINSTAIVSLIAGYTLFDPITAAHWMMAGLSLGAFLISLAQLWAVPNIARARLFAVSKKYLTQALRFKGRRSFWSGVSALALVALVNEVYIYIDFYLASSLEVGSISLLGFASRIAYLTNTLIVGSAFVILEPRWARKIAESGVTAWNATILPDSLSIIGVVSVPVAILYVFPGEVTALLYNSNEYDTEAQRKIVSLTQVFSIGIICIALDMIMARAVVIANKQRWIFLISFTLIPVKILLSNLLIDDYGVVGLAMATVCVVFLQAIGNMIILFYANIPILFKVRDGFALASIFIIMLFFTKIIAITLGKNIISLFIACLILPMIALIVGKVIGFNYSSIISKRIGLS